MATDYDGIATEYTRAKLQPWREYVECHTLFKLIGDVTGKAVIDLACGEGFYTRRLRQHGAARAVGVDISHGMIDLARGAEARDPLGVEYVVRDVKQLAPPGRFGLAVAAYLLNYASTREELVLMCRAIARALEPGGRFVTVNNNPDEPPEHFAAGRPYGFLKSAPEGLREGAPINWKFFLDGGAFEITNYYLSRATMVEAFHEAGLADVRWYAPEVSPGGVSALGRDHWEDFLASPPVIFIECVKPA
jgi:SAM-dependent methyltransferase